MILEAYKDSILETEAKQTLEEFAWGGVLTRLRLLLRQRVSRRGPLEMTIALCIAEMSLRVSD